VPAGAGEAPLVRVRIHRGAHEIGGSCVELEAGGRRLVLDLGLPLDSARGDAVPLPAIPGLAGGDPSLLGIVVSHPHPDHYGFVERVDASVPVYMGQAAQQILAEAAFFGPTGAVFNPAGYLRDRVPFDLGPFRITPFLMDHSAFDTYALLVEAGGRRLFYSGDVRAHGRKQTLFERLVASPPADVHALLLEGTHVRDVDRQSEGGLGASELEDEMADLMKRTEGMVLACYSAQNIDRVVTLYRAARRSGRFLVLDLYGASLVAAAGRTIPQPGWGALKVYVPNAQRVRVKQAGAFERIDAIGGQRLFPERLGKLAPNLVMTFRGSMARELERADCLDGAAAVWSMWRGYLDQPSGQKQRRWFDSHDIPVTLLHSSGHASVVDLQRLASAMGAQQVVPIHTAAPQRFVGLFENVVQRRDGEWWDV